MVSRPQEVSPDAEEILHDTVNRREPLELSGRLETPHLALTLSGRLMGGLRAVVRVLIGAMKHRWHHRATTPTGRVIMLTVNLVRAGALFPRDIDAPDCSQQAHVTASHSTNARVRSRRW